MPVAMSLFAWITGICHMSHIITEPVFMVSDQVRHKLGCTSTEDGLKFEILELGGRGMYEGCQKSLWTHMIKALNGPDFDIH